ncbi:MAG: hypothetical protein HY420_02665 [Candidatus Kerfeldbacteria bacterium]|nr:hypothetical protein [Candidatus Kerfeldbacteria bacterium]
MFNAGIIEHMVREGSLDWTNKQIIQMLEDIAARWKLKHFLVRNEPELRILEQQAAVAVKAATFKPEEIPALRSALKAFISAADNIRLQAEMRKYLIICRPV